MYQMCICVLTSVYSVYNANIRRTDDETKRFDKEVGRLRFTFLRHGGNHDVYIRGNDKEEIPRHKEINEKLAKAIIRRWE